MADGRWCRQAHESPNGVCPIMTSLPVLLLLSLALLTPGRAVAQSLAPTKEPAQKTPREQPIPKAYLPPPGMCRIWVDNVPAARQPAPTDCATAIRNRPPNARVIFPDGKDAKDSKAAPRRPADTTKRKPPA